MPIKNNICSRVRVLRKFFVQCCAVLLVCNCAPPVTAQTANVPADSSAHAAASLAQPRTAWQKVGDDLGTSLGDAGTIFSAPARWDVNSWTDASCVVLGTAAFMTFDSTGRRWVKANQSSDLNNLANVGRFYGETTTGAGIAAAVYLGGLALNNDKVRVTGRMLFESLLFSGVVTTFLKFAIGRSRPYTDQGQFAFHGLQFGADNISMPSGHTTVAFAVSSVIAARFNNPMAYILCYGLATITAGARVYEDQHWLSDVFLGGCIGALIGNAVAHLHDDDAAKHSWRVVPTLNGLALVGRF